MTEREYTVALYAFTAFGPRRLALLLSYFDSAQDLWNASPKQLLETGLSNAIVEKFPQHKNQFPRDYFARLKDKQIGYVITGDDLYPPLLAEIEAPAYVLYYRGDIKLAQRRNSIAVVGTRKMTSYGRNATEKIAGELALLGCTVVSGLALGIDAVAHEAALSAGGATIAVIACGLDTIYPASNLTLAKRMLSGKGLILSEFPLGYPALRNNFVMRNRIISGLSRAVVVVEGEKKSGTLLTASAAAEQGRDVFAIPGAITSPMSEAPHFLLANGGKIATSGEDILSTLAIEFQMNSEEVEAVMPSDEVEKNLVNILSKEPLHIDEIARSLEIPVYEITAKLSMMQLKGLVKDLGSGVYGVT